MSGFFKEMERIIKGQHDAHLDHILHYYGVEIKRFSTDKNVHSDVYGSLSGNNGSLKSTFVGVLVGDDFFPADNAYAGNFIEGYCYTKEELVPSDILEVDSADNKVRRYKVESAETIGTQDTVFKKYKLANLAN